MRTEKKLVSIIIPVYNAESRIAECLDSVLQQSYSKIEVLIVDDGSTDGTADICRKYQSKDKRIRIFSQGNAGPAAARNRALKAAGGEYVQFVDADDCVERDITRQLTALLEQKTPSGEEIQLAVCSYCARMGQEEIDCEFCYEGLQTRNQYLAHFQERPSAYYFGVMWNKLYRMSLIRENGLVLQENYRLGEDFVFNLQYLLHCENLAFTGKILYYYEHGGGESLTNKQADVYTSVEERLKLYHEYVAFYRELGVYQDQKKEIDHYILSHACFEDNRVLYQMPDKGFWEKKERIQYIHRRCLEEEGLSSPYNNIVTLGKAWLADRRLVRQIRQWLAI